MRALFVNENIGGHVSVHQRLERTLEERPDVEARFLHVPPPGLGRRLVTARIPPLDRLDADLKPLRAELAVSLYMRRRLASALEGCDVVHVYTHNAVLLSAPLLRKVPTVIALDTTNAQNAFLLPYRRPTAWTGRMLPLTQWFERRVYDAATLILANSEWAAGSLREDYDIPAGKIRTLSYGMDVPDLPPPPPDDGGLPRIVFVGRSMERKGGTRLLRLHRERLREHCRLVLVTPEAVAPAPGVEVVGDVTPGDGRLLGILRGSRAFVFPSEIDMWPNAVLEAMSAAVPVVALRVNALQEMVPPGAGLLVDALDDDALVAAIRRLVDDPAEAARMGERARAVVLEQHDSRASTARLVEVLGEAIALHSARSR